MRIKYNSGYKHQTLQGVLTLLENVTHCFKYKAKWQCYCNNFFEAYVGKVISGNVKSCGCWNKSVIERKVKDPNIQYLISLYRNIKNRCYNIYGQDYHHYGGRGISIDNEWKNDQNKFIEDILINLGQRPTEKHQLDRVDNNGNYEIPNLRWATQKENNRNKRSSRLITINNETKTLAEWSELSNIKREVISDRANRGWPEEKLLQPVKQKIEKEFDNTNFYSIWSCIKDRCYNKNSKKYKRYGSRGIIISDLWKDSYEKFQQDILDNIGVRPSINHQIDRINNDGNYEISNIRWATNKEQSVNKSDNLIIEINGKSKTCSQWAEEYKISSHLIAMRYNKYGWRDENLLNPAFSKKFNEKEIELIKNLSLEGVSISKISAKMNCNSDTISDILRGRGAYKNTTMPRV